MMMAVVQRFWYDLEALLFITPLAYRPATGEGCTVHPDNYQS